MNKRLTFSLLALIVVFSMALSACGSAATPAPTERLCNSVAHYAGPGGY